MRFFENAIAAGNTADLAVEILSRYRAHVDHCRCYNKSQTPMARHSVLGPRTFSGNGDDRVDAWCGQVCLLLGRPRRLHSEVLAQGVDL